MNDSAPRYLLVAALLATPLLAIRTANAADPAEISCHMTYDMKGWSAVYNTAQGTGTVSCSDGTSMPVVLDAKGAGLTAGTAHIDNGSGSFTGVNRIDDVIGSYASASASGGAARAGEAKVLTKGSISLALAGSGGGWGAGVAISRFRIERVGKTPTASTP